MLKIIVTLLAYLISIITLAQNTNENYSNEDRLYSISATVNNVISDSGSVKFALYDSEDGFKQRKPIKAVSSKIKNGITTVNFEGLVSKTYAILCYHDVNDNGKMDFQNNGMPLEDYGATNNVMNFGPPKYSNAKFELKDKDLTFEIKF
ncbi:MAG: DUF2141 domain-containing protein [Bacteroidota bacterium]